MPEIFVVSDTHFSHENFLTFRNAAGKLIRPFGNVNAMDEYMITQWNKVVTPQDKVYHLGDVGFNRNRLEEILPQLNGKKRLILGNHDGFKMRFYEKYFKRISVWRLLDGIALTHIPIRIDTEMDHRLSYNVHGHIHEQLVPDPAYFNACVEHHDYTPVNWTVIKERLKC